MIGLAATAAAALGASTAPFSTKDTAFSGLRFHTVTAHPCGASCNARANAEPMFPTPMTVTSLIFGPFHDYGSFANSLHGLKWICVNPLQSSVILFPIDFT